MATEKYAIAQLVPKTDDQGNPITVGSNATQNISTSESSKFPPITVHFNPETLNITFSSNMQPENKNQPSKVVSETKVKLSMDLIFDTTLPGEGESTAGKDVRIETNKIVRLMDPTQISPRARNTDETKLPSIVVFQWGTIWFEGYIDSLTEKIELFSSNGVPLRATLSIGMTQQKRSYDPVDESAGAAGGGQGGIVDIGSNTPIQRISSTKSITDVARSLGNAGGTRRLAAQNGIENPRHPEVDELVVGDPIHRQPPGITPKRSNKPGTPAPGALGNTESKFTRLHSQPNPSHSVTPRKRFSPNIGGSAGGQAGIGANTNFGPAGEMDKDCNASLVADVGVNADFQLGIQFEE